MRTHMQRSFNFQGILYTKPHTKSSSGRLGTSETDRRISRKVEGGGTFLDIDVLDHNIFTSATYYSMADNTKI